MLSLTLSQDSSAIVDGESYGNLWIGDHLGILKKNVKSHEIKTKGPHRLLAGINFIGTTFKPMKHLDVFPVSCTFNSKSEIQV